MQKMTTKFNRAALLDLIRCCGFKNQPDFCAALGMPQRTFTRKLSVGFTAVEVAAMHHVLGDLPISL